MAGLRRRRQVADARRALEAIVADYRTAYPSAMMVNSQRYVNAPWRYERIKGANQWMQLTAPDRLNALLIDYLAIPSTELTSATH